MRIASFLLAMILVSLSYLGIAQDEAPRTIDQDLTMLYEASRKAFESLKGDVIDDTDGEKLIMSKLEITGSNRNIIMVDAENSHTYFAHFPATNLEEGVVMADELASKCLEVLGQKNFRKVNGTDVKYYKYRSYNIEFNSDNIDLMGRHPSVSFGVKEGDEVKVEMKFNEPLWK